MKKRIYFNLFKKISTNRKTVNSYRNDIEIPDNKIEELRKTVEMLRITTSTA